MTDIMHYLNSGLDMKNSILKALPSRKISNNSHQGIEEQFYAKKSAENFKKNTFWTGSDVQKSLTQSAIFSNKNLRGKSNFKNNIIV